MSRRRSALGAPLAWLQLAGEPMRLVAAIAGIAFAVLLMLMQIGIREALFRSATRLHERLRADLVMTSSHYQYQGEAAAFAERRLIQALGDPGVASATPLLLGVADWRNPEGRTAKRVFLVGFDPALDPIGLPEVESARDLLRRPGWVMFDRQSRRDYGPVAARFESEGPFVGELGNHRVTIAGLFDLGASFAADGNLVMSDVTLRQVSEMPAPGTISVGLITTAPGADPIAVRDRLRQRLGGGDVLVMTLDEYIASEKEYWARRTPIGFVLTAGLLVGFAVGSVIVYQILYTDVLDHLHEYATLKAIGYTNRQLVTVVFQQSFILSAIGFLPGLGLAAIVYHLIREMARLPANLTVGARGRGARPHRRDVRRRRRAGDAQAGRGGPRRGVLTVTSSAVVEARGLSYSFGEGTHRRRVLAELDLAIEPGEIVLLTGPSGSGKTTLLALIAALRSVQEGSLRVLDVELKGAGAATAVAVRRRIGFVFQSHNLLRSLTALQNVVLSPALLDCDVDEARSRAQDALASVGLEDRAGALPRQLSGGQRQRIAIARALVGRPAILLADEPTASLDATTGREMVDLLRDLARRQRCAVLMVTHDSRILDVADRVLSIEDGRLETAGQTLAKIAIASAALLGRLPAYIELLRARSIDRALGAVRQDFARAAAEAQTLIADLERKNLPGALRDRAFSLQRQHSRAVELEASLVEFLAQSSALGASPTLASRADTFVEAFDTVLRAGVEAATVRGEIDIQLLLSMTEDKGPLMRDIRRSTLEPGSSLSLEQQATLFEVTHVFERMTYFIRGIAQELAAGAGARFE